MVPNFMFTHCICQNTLEYIKTGKKSVLLTCGPGWSYHGICTVSSASEQLTMYLRDMHYYDNVVDLFDKEDFRTIYPDLLTKQSAIDTFHKWKTDDDVQSLGGINAYIISHVDDV